MLITQKLITILVTICACMQVFCRDVNNTSDLETNGKHEVLSRRKRFIIFPEGSSVQLVFCLTFPLISPIGDIVLWGYTSALAYELPQDPYSPFRHHADPLHRRVDDSKTIYYTDEVGRVLFKRPYKRKSIVNPAFAKRSVDGADSVKVHESKKGLAGKFKADRKQMHASRHKREFLNSEHMDERRVEFHRRTRAVLYRKIETILQAHGSNGRHCLLKTLCLVGQTKDYPQGSFLQEILRATFTLPDGREFADDYEKDYDAAHLSNESCDILYPECDEAHSEPSTQALNT